MPKKAEAPEKRPVPAWMMSFSDMMTNLLCFFILMVAMATMQEAGFEQTGVGSYLDKLEALGLPGLMPSRRTLIPRDSPLARYKPPRIDPLAAENWVEHVDKMVSEELDRLNSGEGQTEEPGRSKPIALGLSFSPKSDRLTLTDRENIRELAVALRGKPGVIEVQGACTTNEMSSERDRLELSLKRALAVTRYLQRSGLPAEKLIAVGAGSHAGKGDGENTSPRLVSLRIRS